MKNLQACFSLLMVTLCLGAIGCNSDGLPSDAAAVKGTVTYNGQAVADAMVNFQSDSGFAAAGKTNSEGVYQLNSASIPGGTQPGEYQITVTKREEVKQTTLTEEDPNYNPNRPQVAPPKPKHLLPEKYSRPTSSGLTAKITAGENVVNLDLVK